MNSYNTVPAQDGFRMPAEFEAHEGTILIWPVRPGSWPYGGEEAQETFLQIATALAEDEKVFFCAGPHDFQQMQSKTEAFLKKHAREAVKDNLVLLTIPSDDSWARDIGPTMVVDADGNRRGINWQFNAWGGEWNGLYAKWDEDDAFANRFLASQGLDSYDASDLVLEGGSIHTDGDGTLVVTEVCLLSEGRNPKMTKEEIEERLKGMLDVEKVIWLPNGIYNDETDGHVDNIFAFTAPGEAVLAWTDDEADPQYELSRRNLEILEAETDAKGRTINVHKLLIPKVPVTITEEDLAGLKAEPGEDEREAGERLAASYVNFYVGNGSVLVPAFGDVNDDKAAAVLAELFPERKIVQIPARSIIVGGGNIHCITQQIPAGRK